MELSFIRSSNDAKSSTNDKNDRVTFALFDGAWLFFNRLCIDALMGVCDKWLPVWDNNQFGAVLLWHKG